MKLLFTGFVAMYGVMTVAFMAVGAIIDGWVLSILWGWFMIPVFHLPPLTIAPAIGIALMIGLLTREVPRPFIEEKTPQPVIEKTSRTNIEEMDRGFWGKLARNVVMLLLFPFITLFLGWVANLFM